MCFAKLRKRKKRFSGERTTSIGARACSPIGVRVHTRIYTAMCLCLLWRDSYCVCVHLRVRERERVSTPFSNIQTTPISLLHTHTQCSTLLLYYTQINLLCIVVARWLSQHGHCTQHMQICKQWVDTELDEWLNGEWWLVCICTSHTTYAHDSANRSDS